MSASFNKVIALGNVGREPEVRYTQGGDAVANFSIACNETWKDKEGKKQERTEWIRCTAFGRLAEIAGEYATKGMPILVEGALQTRQWEDKDGNKRETVEVKVFNLKLLGKREDAPAKTTEKPASRRNQNADFDDDVPF